MMGLTISNALVSNLLGPISTLLVSNLLVSNVPVSNVPVSNLPVSSLPVLNLFVQSTLVTAAGLSLASLIPVSRAYRILSPGIARAAWGALASLIFLPTLGDLAFVWITSRSKITTGSELGEMS